MATSKADYQKWALQHKTKEEMSEKDKEALAQMEQEDLNIKDSYKRQASGWSDEKRDSFKKEKADKEGIDYTIDLQKLNSVITEGKPIVILAVGTTGLRGSKEDTFFNSDKSKNATRLANGQIELSTENIKNCSNDTITQVSFVYYEKGKDGFYHENEELSLKIPLVNVAPSIIQRSEEDYQQAIANGRSPYDVFKEGGINVQDLKDKKGVQSDKLVHMVDEYLAKDEIKNAVLMDFQPSVAPNEKKDFAINMISHTYDAVNLMVKPKEKVSFDHEIDINLYTAINGYNLTGNRRICPGKVNLNVQVGNLKQFKGEEPLPLHTSYEKVQGIAYLLNEFCLREMLEKNSPETNLKIYEYCTLYDAVDKNKQKQTDENREKLEGLRNEIASEIDGMKTELEYYQSMDDTFPDLNDAYSFDESEYGDLEMESDISEDMPDIPDMEDIEEPDLSYNEEYSEEEDKSYSEVSAVDSVEDMVVTPQTASVSEGKTEVKTETVAIETTEKQEGNLYTDKEGGMNVPVITAENIQKVGETVIPEIAEAKAIPSNDSADKVPVPEAKNQPITGTVTKPDTEASMRELELLKKELELRSLEADLKLKEVELAKRELDLQSKQPEMLRLAQNNNFALMQTFCKTIGVYLNNDKQGQKVLMDTMKEIAALQKDYNDKMFALDGNEKKGEAR